MTLPPVIIKLGGLAVESPERATPLLRAVAHAAMESLIILVHGGGKAVDEHLAQLGIVSERREGLRVTSDAEIHEVVAVLAGRVNKAIVGAMNTLGCRAVGLTLSDGAVCRARRLERPIDLGRVGEVTGGDARLLNILLAERFIPVLAPIAHDDAGAPLNINADDAAAAVASIVGARLLILLTDVPGVLDASRQPIESLDRARAESLIAENVISGGMIPKVRAALAAADRARCPAVIASWNDPDSIAALLRGEPRGTRLTPSP